MEKLYTLKEAKRLLRESLLRLFNIGIKKGKIDYITQNPL
jgi:hypothetical protein